jgi:LAS superfamily LD-carboxypeptidase LdcB
MRDQNSRSNQLILFLSVLLASLIGYLLLTDSGRALIARLINRAPRPLYVCPLVASRTADEVANCSNCIYYPIGKFNRVPATYKPYVIPTELSGGGKLIPEARNALLNLFSLAQGMGHSPTVTSAYRSYEEQVQVFNGWVYQEWTRTNNLILAHIFAARYSARPGHSEHQLGTAVDVNCERCIPFDVSDPKNLALWSFFEEYGHRVGFVISYPHNMEDRTGYQY